MTRSHKLVLSVEMRAAVGDLKSLILSRYPGAEIQVGRSPDEADAIVLWTAIDIDDLDEVIDFTIDRVMQYQIDDGLPLWVVPIHSTEYALAQLAASRVDLSAKVPA